MNTSSQDALSIMRLGEVLLPLLGFKWLLVHIFCCLDHRCLALLGGYF